MVNSDKNLKKLDSWNSHVAEAFADELQIAFQEEHLEIVKLARSFFDEYGFSPSLRPLCKYIALNLETKKANGLYLNKLFPGSPAKNIAYIAGIPKPKNCL